MTTRPPDVNGFGLTPVEAEAEIARLLEVFSFTPDDPSIYPQWLHLVATHGVSGVKVHDARLVAVMCSHGITHLLTLNPGDFKRYSEITPVGPDAIAPVP